MQTPKQQSNLSKILKESKILPLLGRWAEAGHERSIEFRVVNRKTFGSRYLFQWYWLRHHQTVEISVFKETKIANF